MGSHFVKVIRELTGIILSRGPKLCNFVEWRGLKVVYKRYGVIVNLIVPTSFLLSYSVTADCSIFLHILKRHNWFTSYVFMSSYAGLYFSMCIDQDDNELETLDIIHHYVEMLDRYFLNVSMLDPHLKIDCW